jgi:alanine racemase
MMPLGVASPSTPQVRIAGPGQRRRGSGADVPRTFVTRRATRVATIPVGLADGLGMEPATRLLRFGPLLRAMLRRLLRRLGLGAGAGGVAFDGRDAPVLGRMAMQQTTVDVTALPDVAEGSVAELFLRPAAASARLARVYLRDGVAVRARTLAGEVDLRRHRAVAERG